MKSCAFASQVVSRSRSSRSSRGFLTDGGLAHFARPVGLAIAKDGSLLMADDANGVIYRIAYTGRHGASRVLEAPAGPMLEQARARQWCAHRHSARSETSAPARLELSIHHVSGGTIRAEHSRVLRRCVAASSWSAVKARSHMRDHGRPRLAAHQAFRALAGLEHSGRRSLRLPEGLQEQERLLDPRGAAGSASRGSAGLLGPRPPVGDPPHRYHFQVFALDTVPRRAARRRARRGAAGHVRARAGGR